MPEPEWIVPPRGDDFDPAARHIEAGLSEDSPIVEALRAGMMFYKAPELLTPNDVDSKLWAAVELINKSGWVWTGESCQGHPDAKDPSAWSTRPYLRLISRTRHLPVMLDDLFEVAGECANRGMGWNPTFHVSVSKRTPEWTEIYLYIEARTVYHRDRGCDLLDKFAEEIQYDPDAVHEPN